MIQSSPFNVKPIYFLAPSVFVSITTLIPYSCIQQEFVEIVHCMQQCVIANSLIRVQGSVEIPTYNTLYLALGSKKFQSRPKPSSLCYYTLRIHKRCQPSLLSLCDLHIATLFVVENFLNNDQLLPQEPNLPICIVIKQITRHI